MKRDKIMICLSLFFLACGLTEAVAHGIERDWLTCSMGLFIGLLPGVICWKLSECNNE